MVIDTQTFMASPSPDRVSRLRSPSDEFCPPQRLLLACGSHFRGFCPLSHLVPGGRLRMSSLRICLHRSWDRLDPSAPVPWSLDCLRDLRWWLRGDRFSRGVSLLQVSPVLAFWSDASDVGLGPHLGDKVVSGLWDQSEALLPVNARELLAVRHGLLHFRSFLSGTTVAVFCGNVTSVPYLLRWGGGGGATGLLLSTPLPRGSSVGRNLFGFDWLRSSFRGSTMFSRTLSPVLTSSPVPNGFSTWTYFDLCGVGGL